MSKSAALNLHSRPWMQAILLMHDLWVGIAHAEEENEGYGSLLRV